MDHTTFDHKKATEMLSALVSAEVEGVEKTGNRVDLIVGILNAISVSVHRIDEKSLKGMLEVLDFPMNDDVRAIVTSYFENEAIDITNMLPADESLLIFDSKLLRKLRKDKGVKEFFTELIAEGEINRQSVLQ